MVEHLTLNQGVRGSSPRRPTRKSIGFAEEAAESVFFLRKKFSCRKLCGFYICEESVLETMIYEKMIETENSDPRYQIWSEYRQALTAYILDGIESYYRREHLAKQRKLRDCQFVLDKDVPLEKKPVVAIWGAGRCNDLDLQMLAPYVRFVLIDRTMKDIQTARQRYGLSEVQCACVDLKFWEIYEEEEQFFETLLVDANDLHLSEYLRQVMESVVEQNPEFAEFEHAFDFSVVCGLASQLNARFAGMLDIYGKDLQKLPRTVAVMKEMNMLAARRLTDAIITTTNQAVFAANEIYAASPVRKDRLADYAEIWTEEWEHILMVQKEDQDLPEDVEGITCQVAGSREFELYLMRKQKEGRLVFRHRSGIVWPFSAEKYYFMDVLTAYFVNKEIN